MPAPTQTLDETIRALAARGEISSLTISMNASHTKWQAVYVPCSVFGRSVAEDVDPVKALLTALSTIKLASKKPRLKDVPAVDVIEQPTVEVEPEDDIDALM
jgi:hypothetical protein